jgi:hypothetical protein
MDPESSVFRSSFWSFAAATTSFALGAQQAVVTL